MKIKTLEIQNFRNIEDMILEPDEGVNIIYGENAQGKTNLLEAIWMFTGMRSFRSAKEKDFIRFGERRAKLKMSYDNDVREQNAEIDIAEKKQIILGGVKKSSSSALIGEFLGTIFSPGHLELVQGGPNERRRFLNTALCQLKPNYARRLQEFNKILQERNVLLKDLRYHSELLDTLDIWDERFASFSAFLIRERLQYLDLLTPHLKEFYSGISGGKEDIDVEYHSSLPVSGSDASLWKEPIMESLQLHRAEDIQTGYTTAGPHRDDMDILLNGISVKSFGSQGQQRSCALSLKMAEAAVIRQITGKQPVMLLDDVMSELDNSRQDYILNHIDGWQVFLTCCEPSDILRTKSETGKMIEIQGGKICSST